MVENHTFHDVFAPIFAEFSVRNRVYRIAIPLYLICGGNVVVNLVFVKGAIQKAERVDEFARTLADIYEMIAVAVKALFVRVHKAVRILLRHMLDEFRLRALLVFGVNLGRSHSPLQIAIVIAERERPRRFEPLEYLAVAVEVRSG